MYCENPNDDDDACNGMPMRMRMQTVSRPKYAQYPGLDERIKGAAGVPHYYEQQNMASVYTAW